MEKNKLMMIIIIILLVVLLVTILGVAFVGFNMIASTNTDSIVEMSDEEEPKISPTDIEVLNLSEPIVANLRIGSDGEKHAAQVEVGIGINNDGSKEATAFYNMLVTKEVIIEDIILGILSNKTAEDLLRPDAREILKDEILQDLREKFDTDLIVEIYIGRLYVD